jgi:hypothetical protein
MSPFLPAPTAVFVAAVGATAVGGGLWERRRALRQARWPRVCGAVTAARVHTDGDPLASNVSVAYRYEVAGTEYEGYAPAFRATSVEGKAAEAESMAALHPPGTVVWVYYDPAAPAHSVLEPPDAAGAGLTAVAAGTVAVAVAAYALVGG